MLIHHHQLFFSWKFTIKFWVKGIKPDPHKGTKEIDSHYFKHPNTPIIPIKYAMHHGEQREIGFVKFITIDEKKKFYLFFNMVKGRKYP